MEPEFEMAIRVASIVEAFWDGNPPVISQPKDKLELWELLPESDLKEYLSEGHPARNLRPSVEEFLSDRSRRKPRLRRAAKAVGLWMEERADHYIDADFPERYVPTRSPDDLLLAARRMFTPPRGKEQCEEVVLEELTKKCAELLSEDLHSSHHKITGPRFWQNRQSGREQDSRIVSLGRLRHDLANHFYEKPDCLVHMIDALDYLPSFLAGVAEVILEFSGTASTSDSGRARARCTGFRLPFQDWKLQRACDQLGICTAKVYEFEQASGPNETSRSFLAGRMLSRIKPEAQPIPAASILLSACRWNELQFEIGRQLLLEDDKTAPPHDACAHNPKLLRVANFLEFPVPFAMTLWEELREIRQSREVRRQWKP